MKKFNLLMPILAALFAIGWAGPAKAETLSGPEMRRYLASITVKEVRFEQATVEEVLKKLSAIGRERGHPMNLVLRDPGKERPRISLDLRGSTMLDILQTVNRIAGLRMEYKQGILFFSDSRPMELRVDFHGGDRRVTF